MSPLPARILVVDDDVAHAEAMAEGLDGAGYEVVQAHSGVEAEALVLDEVFDVVVTDLVMQDRDGFEVLRTARSAVRPPAVLLVSGHGTVERATRAMRDGAADFLAKPINLEELRTRVDRALAGRQLEQENRDLHRRLDQAYGIRGLIGRAPSMQSLCESILQVAPSPATVLVRGESGTGKELVARALHEESSRRAGPFHAVNCAAFSAGIIESELFGHEKGAFTGAVSRRIGTFEAADSGTLLLDEIGDMPLETQAKVLRVLEERTVQRVGSSESVPVDVRVVAATNADLEQRISEGTFREDLYFRINVVVLHVPALRDRSEDLPLLVDTFVDEFSAAAGREAPEVTPGLRALLAAHPWPGNVRELRNILESMVVMDRDGVLDEDDWPGTDGVQGSASGSFALLGRSLADVERELIRVNLEASGGNRKQCADVLGIGERTLYRKLSTYGL